MFPRHSSLSMALLTDLYQLTMSYGYWKTGMHGEEAVFHLFFRKHPFKGGFTIACGLAEALAFLKTFRFDDSDIDYLGTLKGNNNEALFEKAFLEYLRKMELACDIQGIPEGTVVFPHEPLLRVQGPILQCQLLETVLLNILNFQTLIATKAARICLAAKREPVLEFGLRRAQGVDGSLAASRAAYIGGCGATSNVLAGKLFGIPVKGTHAHSWVMSFDDEQEAFEAYARAMPNNCVFLVDTYDTLEGVRKAARVGRRLREQGHEMVGIRLDSGDLAYLSIEARRILDQEGFPDAQIVASNDLDEYIIDSLKQQGAKIAVWGVGTKLATAYDQPALGGVYKLAAIRAPGQEWRYKVKLSEQSVKVSNPGIQQVRRYRVNQEYVADAIYDVGTNLDHGCEIVDPKDMTRHRKLEKETAFEDLLVPLFDKGRCVYASPPIHELRAKALADLDRFHEGIKRFVHAHAYPVGLEKSLMKRKNQIIGALRGIEV